MTGRNEIKHNSIILICLLKSNKTSYPVMAKLPPVNFPPKKSYIHVHTTNWHKPRSHKCWPSRKESTFNVKHYKALPPSKTQINVPFNNTRGSSSLPSWGWISSLRRDHNSVLWWSDSDTAAYENKNATETDIWKAGRDEHEKSTPELHEHGY